MFLKKLDLFNLRAIFQMSYLNLQLKLSIIVGSKRFYNKTIIIIPLCVSSNNVAK